MNTSLFALAILELALSLFMGVFIMYFSIRFLKARYKKYVDITEHNTAFHIVLGASVFSIGYLLTGCTQPITNCLRMLNHTESDQLHVVLESVKYIFIFIAIGLALGLLVNWLTIWLYGALTRDIDELHEIDRGSMSTAILLSVIVVVITLFVREGYVLLLESIIPYPQLPILPK